MTVVRRALAGLPLQRSLFSELWRAGQYLGLAAALPAGRFGAGMDQRGDLSIDPESVRALEAAFPLRPDQRFLERIEGLRRRRIDALNEATERAERSAPTLPPDAASALLLDLGERMAAVLPYPILTKIVPPLLARGLQEAGDHRPPPMPRPSPGLRLSIELFELRDRCRDLGWAPDRLEEAWPAVPADIAVTVGSFCEEHAGFGPVAWEAPSYETPRYAIHAMATLAGAPPELPPAGSEAPVQGARAVLRDWLELMERQIWLVRRPFYLGFVPLLRRLAPAWRRQQAGLAPQDLLFAECAELRPTPPEQEVLSRRKERYLADEDYLRHHGVGPDRLASIMSAP